LSTLSSVIQSGTLAAMPAASIPGRLYFTSDTLHVYRDSGTAWVDCTPVGGALSNPMTTAGDLIVAGTGGLPTRMAAGANGNLLTIAAGVPTYVAPSYDAAGAAAAAAAIAANASNLTSGTVAPARLPVATASTLGVVEPDGTTITIAGGIISAPVTGLPSGVTNLVLATPNGSTGIASLRALVAADVPTLNQSTTGTAAGLSTALVVSRGGLATATAPAAAQIPIAQSASAYAPTTVGGDGTLSTAGALVVTKTNGVAFAASATTDATNAANISSGTLPAARLPLASSTAFGGVKVDGTTITAAAGVISATATALPSGVTNLVLATPNGSTGIASLRALVAADVPTLNQSTSGTAAGLSTALVVGQGGLATATAPATAQIPIAQSASAYAPKTISGDGTLSTAGALVVTKTNGVAFATSATTDATNASNITSGTLAAARLPAAINATSFTQPTINGGISQGSGVKTARVALTTPAFTVNATADTSFTWPTPFADANYTVTAVCHTVAGTITLSLYGLTNAGFTIRAINPPGTSCGTLTAHIIAIHD
jgi:hypothetical protein